MGTTGETGKTGEDNRTTAFLFLDSGKAEMRDVVPQSMK